MTENSDRDKPTDLAPAGPPSITVDWDRYGQYLEESDLSDAEKRAFLETLWSIVVSFVDLGFGVHPVQQACENSCAQSAEIRAFITEEHASVVGSSDTDITDGDAGPSSLTQERRAT